jgi:Zn-dependent protease with chaperone function
MKRCTVICLAVLLLVLSFPSAASALQLISKEQEIEIGREASVELEQKYGLVDDPALLTRLRFWGRRIADKSERPDLPYTFKILNMKEVNALSLPGGLIYITKGLADLGAPAQELENVLGHEIAHAARRHVATALERTMGVDLILQVLTGGKSKKVLTYQILQLLLQRGYSREDEFDADHQGARYVFEAGYDPQGMIDFLQRLLKMSNQKSDILGPVLSTHPDTQERINRLTSYAKELKGSGSPPPAPPEPPSTPAPSPAPSPSPQPSPSLQPASQCPPCGTPGQLPPLQVTITSPGADQKVGDKFPITGRTEPGATVSIKVEFSSGGFLNVISEMRSVDVQAGSNGEFLYDFEASLPFQGGMYIITATAKDGRGRQSEKVSITVKR